jgi:hypothetical protein
MRDGRIEPLDASAAVEYTRGKRVAKQAEALAREGPRVTAVEESDDEGTIRPLAETGVTKSADPGVTKSADPGVTKSPGPIAGSSALPRPARPVALPAHTTQVLVLIIAVGVGLLAALLWRSYLGGAN